MLLSVLEVLQLRIIVKPYWKVPISRYKAWEKIGASAFLRRHIRHGISDLLTVIFDEGEIIPQIRQTKKDMDFSLFPFYYKGKFNLFIPFGLREIATLVPEVHGYPASVLTGCPTVPRLGILDEFMIRLL